LDLFGKRKYEERIEDLLQRLSSQQKEREDLLKTIEKRDEKIRKLTSTYQESCVALKAAEQKASQSQAASALLKPEGPMETAARGIWLGPHDIERLMKMLQAYRSPYDDSFTGYVQNASDLPDLPGDILKQIKSLRSRRGLIIFHSPQLFTLALVPPFPVNEKLIEAGSAFRLDPLKEMMDTPVIVASVHAGDTFLGMALSHEDFEEQENVLSPVKEKHSKGGWSQKRFERLREEDIKGHVEAVTKGLSDLSKRYGSVAKFAVLAGDSVLIKQIAPSVDIPVLERQLERNDESSPRKLLEDVYGFRCYRF
jgi:uncharacterized protein YeeX (DUF496 family)